MVELCGVVKMDSGQSTVSRGKFAKKLTISLSSDRPTYIGRRREGWIVHLIYVCLTPQYLLQNVYTVAASGSDVCRVREYQDDFDSHHQ